MKLFTSDVHLNILLLIILCECVFMLMCTCVCMCIYVDVCGAQEPREQQWVSSSITVHLFFFFKLHLVYITCGCVHTYMHVCMIANGPQEPRVQHNHCPSYFWKLHLNLYYVCVCRGGAEVGSKRTTCRNQFSLFTKCFPGSNSGHQFWQQVPLSAAVSRQPYILIQDFSLNLELND